jgi:[acyl-carrier-protein] S-malonyltransferase
MSGAEAAAQFASVALIFPGQGSQYPGMAVDLARDSSTAREILERADEVLGYALSTIMAGDSEEALDRTIHTQPAVFVHSLALYEVIRERILLAPVVAAGHSLGEISALCAAGVLNFDTALEIVRVRAKAMDEAQPAGMCGMAAIIGLSAEHVRELVNTHRQGEILEAANFNAPDQVVVSGTLSAVRRISEAAAKERRTKTVMLPVSSAFHTLLMEPAAAPLRDRLAQASFGSPRFPVVANVSAEVYPSAAEEVRRLLVEQIVRPVLWEDCVAKMRALGADCFLEIGPGKVLSGLLRRIDRSLTCKSVCDLDGVRSLETSTV